MDSFVNFTVCTLTDLFDNEEILKTQIRILFLLYFWNFM